MNKTRSALVSLVLLALAACGADGDSGIGTSTPAPAQSSTTYTVGGSVSGVSGTGVKLQVNGHSDVLMTHDGAFTFADPLSSGASYQVTVATQPANPTETCVVSGGSGTISSANVSNVQVTCTTNSYSVGGTVSGLTGSGLVLSNGSATLSIPANGAWAFGTAVADGSTYNVTVTTQPSSPAQTCSVANGSGTIASASVTNVAVSCVRNDVTPPAVTDRNPKNSMMGWGTLLPITATFSEALTPASVNVSSFTITGPDGAVSGTVSLTNDNKAVFTPGSPLAFDTTYQVKLTTAVRDLSNNALASDVSWSFNTGHKLSLGANHSCVRYDGGQLKCWGLNSKGQLGLGNTNTRGDAAGEMGTALPTVSLGSGRSVIEVAAGGEHTCARLDNNQVKCWGSNQYGQLGLGSTASRGISSGQMGDALPAVQLGSTDVVLQLAAGRYFTCARLDSGQVKCWGRNDMGQLGLGDTASRGDQSGEMGNALQAVNLGTGRTAIDISATAYHMCARLDNGTAKCWGENIYGQLGLGDVNSRGDQAGEMGDALPVLNAGSGYTILQLAVNSGHTCALLDTFALKCWGFNTYGELGYGDTIFRGDDPGEVGDAVPLVDFGTGRTATRVVEGSRHTCVLMDTQQVKCWGYNPNGELGIGDAVDHGVAPGEMGDALPAVDLGTGRTVVELESGSFFVCARLDNDDIKCWGRGTDGVLGLGNTANRGDAPGEMGDNLPAVDLSL